MNHSQSPIKPSDARYCTVAEIEYLVGTVNYQKGPQEVADALSHYYPSIQYRLRCYPKSGEPFGIEVDYGTLSDNLKTLMLEQGITQIGTFVQTPIGTRIEITSGHLRHEFGTITGNHTVQGYPVALDNLERVTFIPIGYFKALTSSQDRFLDPKQSNH